MNFFEGQSPNQEQMADAEFIGDTIGLIRVDDELDPKVASNLGKEKIIEKF